LLRTLPPVPKAVGASNWNRSPQRTILSSRGRTATTNPCGWSLTPNCLLIPASCASTEALCPRCYALLTVAVMGEGLRQGGKGAGWGMEVVPHALHKHTGERVTAVYDCRACCRAPLSPVVPKSHISLTL